MSHKLPPNTLTPRRWSLLAALLVMLAGFGVLNLFSVLGAGRSDLPGLYTFRSATVGDGLLLPVLAYALIRAGGWHLGWTKRQRRTIAAGATVFASGGAVVQASWLLNPNPRLNWTFPAPHEFNGPGWYHAAFLILASGFFGGAATALWLRVRSETLNNPSSPTNRIRSVGAVGVLGPWPGFMALLALDDPGWSPMVLAVGLTAVGVLLVLLVRSATPRVDVRRTALIVLASLMPAAALSALLLPSSHFTVMTTLPAVVAALAGAYGSAVLRVPVGADRLIVALAVALIAAAPVHLAVNVPRSSIPLLSLGAVMSLALTITYLALLRTSLDEDISLVRLFAVPMTMVPITAIALAGRHLAEEKALASTYGNVLTAVAGLLILGVAARGVRIQFDPVIKAEVEDAPDLSALRWQAYLAISTAFFGALLASVTFVIGAAQNGEWIDGTETTWWSTILGMLFVLSFLATMAWWASTRTGPRWRRYTPTMVSALCLLWSAVVGRQLLAGFGAWHQILFALGPAFVSGLFVLESVISNTGRLHNQGLDWRNWVIGGSTGLSVALTTAWMIGPAVQSRDAVTTTSAALFALVVAAAANTLLPFLCASSLAGAHPAGRIIIGMPITGVRQDSFVSVILVVSIGWVPSFFFAHMAGLGASWGAVFSYLALLSAAYVWIMKNNVTHFAREHQRISAQNPGSPLSHDSTRALAALRRHILFQNALAVIALVPLGLFLLVNEITGFDEKGIRQLLRVHPVSQ